MSQTQHLTDLGYVDPWESAQQRAAEVQRHSAALAEAEKRLSAGRYDEAAAQLRQLAAVAPSWTAPRRLLARAELHAGRAGEAIKHLNWLEEHGVEHAELALLRAAAELNQRRLDDVLAGAEYARALAQQPLPAADVLTGQAQLRRGRIDEAEAAFESALAAEPSRGDAVAGLGVVALRRGNWEQAADRMLQALELGMSTPAVHQRLGMALAHMGRLDDAAVALKNAAALAPSSAAPHWWLSNVARLAGRHDLADACRNDARAVVRSRRASRGRLAGG